jgi:hypothetical protein
VLSHYSLLDEKMRLGRNRYTGVSTTDAASKTGESPTRNSNKTASNGTASGDSGDAQLEISNSSFRSVIESVLQLRAIDSIMSSAGSDAEERESKVLDSIKKNCDLFELWESIRYLLAIISVVYSSFIVEPSHQV